MRSPSLRRAAAIAVAAAVIALPAAPAAAATAGSPTIRVITPATYALYFSDGAVTLSGTAADDTGVASVAYEIVDNYNPAGCTGNSIVIRNVSYLQVDGSWACTLHWFPATLTNPNGTSTSWSATVPFSSGTTPALASGDYAVQARVKDVSGNVTVSRRIDFGYGPRPTPAAPGYLTILFGRGQWEPTNDNCTALPAGNAVTLTQAAADLAAMTPARVATSAVVTAYTQKAETHPTNPCVGGNFYSSWTQLQSLKSTYGWTVVSASETHPIPFASASPGTVDYQAQTCGSLTDTGQLYDHGFSEAGGLFAYPNNDFGSSDPSATIQRTYTDQCFAFGRTYHSGRNVAPRMAPPWYQWSTSVQGGTCNDSSAACASYVVHMHSGKVAYYMSPSLLASLANVAGDEWDVLQFYKLVKGSGSVIGKSGRVLSWDCTSGDWRQHYTFDPELYCYNDALSALQAIPANVVTTDPATVASSWGISAPH